MVEHAAGWFQFNQIREDSLTIYYEVNTLPWTYQHIKNSTKEGAPSWSQYFHFYPSELVSTHKS